MPFGPHETAACLFRDKEASVFLWTTAQPGGTLQTHKLRFGQPHEMLSARCDVSEATFELIRQFGLTFPTSAFVVHVSLNSVLLSSLRSLPNAVHGLEPFPTLLASGKNAIRDVAISSVLQLLALLEFMRISIHEQLEAEESASQQQRTLVIFSGLNPLLADQSHATLEQVAICLEYLAQQRGVLAVWISAGDLGGAGGSDGGGGVAAPSLRRLLSSRSTYVSTFDATI